MLLSSVTGYDASGRVDDLAAQLKKQCTSIAIGMHWGGVGGYRDIAFIVCLLRRIGRRVQSGGESYLLCFQERAVRHLPFISPCHTSHLTHLMSLSHHPTLSPPIISHHTVTLPSSLTTLSHYVTLLSSLITLSPFPLRWVLLKNVHLAPQWLVSLEKKLHSLTPHAAFRLFLTMEINPKVLVM